MAKITEKDIEILDFIREQLSKNGYPPTVREIGAAVNLNSPATVHARLNKLENAGLLIREQSKKRSMRLVNHPDDAPEEFDEYHEECIDVPVYGKITAGVPITAIEQLERRFPIPAEYIGNKETFMLKVSGESMINAAILDGDYIIVEKQSTASNGDIVVALINGEDATVKTFYKENGHFRLQPENDYMDPIIADDVAVLGKVIGVFRMI